MGCEAIATKLYHAEGLRITAEAKAAGVIRAGKIPGALMKPWLDDEQEQSDLEPGKIKFFSTAALEEWLSRHVTQEVWHREEARAKLARAAAGELKSLVQSAGWHTTHAAILSSHGHFPIGVKRSNTSFELFMNTHRPEMTARCRKYAVFLDLEESPNLLGMIRQILTGTGNWKPHIGSIRFLFYSNSGGDAFIKWHGDSSATSFETPLRNQLAVCLLDAANDIACRSELAFRTTGHGWSGNAKAYEFDQSANIDTKVYTGLSAKLPATFSPFGCRTTLLSTFCVIASSINPFGIGQN